MKKCTSFVIHSNQNPEGVQTRQVSYYYFKKDPGSLKNKTILTLTVIFLKVTQHKGEMYVQYL
jgi:hypothetical protein